MWVGGKLQSVTSLAALPLPGPTSAAAGAPVAKVSKREHRTDSQHQEGHEPQTAEADPLSHHMPSATAAVVNTNASRVDWSS